MSLRGKELRWHIQKLNFFQPRERNVRISPNPRHISDGVLRELSRLSHVCGLLIRNLWDPIILTYFRESC